MSTSPQTAAYTHLDDPRLRDRHNINRHRLIRHEGWIACVCGAAFGTGTGRASERSADEIWQDPPLEQRVRDFLARNRRTRKPRER